MTLASEVDLQKFLTRERHRVHLVGVAGSGMSGIAALLLELGHDVSGSDKVGSLETDRLQRLGLRFHAQHRAEDADDTEMVIFSSAIKEDNPILVNARALGKQPAEDEGLPWTVDYERPMSAYEYYDHSETEAG